MTRLRQHTRGEMFGTPGYHNYPSELHARANKFALVLGTGLKFHTSTPSLVSKAGHRYYSVCSMVNVTLPRVYARKGSRCAGARAQGGGGRTPLQETKKAFQLTRTCQMMLCRTKSLCFSCLFSCLMYQKFLGAPPSPPPPKPDGHEVVWEAKVSSDCQTRKS